MPEKMVVYRVEHPVTGRGPYRNDDLTCYEADAGHNYHNNDSWSMDGISAPAHYAAGFDSLDKLFEWFAGCMDALVRDNYGIRVFHVDKDDVVMGWSGRQLAFPRFKTWRSHGRACIDRPPREGEPLPSVWEVLADVS